MIGRCWLLIMALWVAPGYAEKNVDLYTAEALVINQTAAVRQQAAATAMTTVLVRMSGSREVLASPSVSEALERASSYLYQFSYQSTDQTITLAGAVQPATLLVMRFSSGPLEQLLRTAGLPLWSAIRPDVLLWASSGSQQYVSIDLAVGKALKNGADTRGLPLSLPVLDLEDRSALPVSRLRAMDEGSIRVAARRYGTDAVLAGRFGEDRNQWTGNFMLLHQGKTQYFTATGGSQNQAATDLINQVADYFANIYAVVPGEQTSEPVLLQVNNIADFTHYAAVINYLKKLPLIESVTPATISETQLTVAVALNTDVDRLLQTLALDKKLIQVASQSTSAVTVSLNPLVTDEPLPAVARPPLEFIWQ